MIFIYLLCVLFAAAIAFYIIQPLTQVSHDAAYALSYKGFADQEELRTVLDLRDACLVRLVHGSSTHATLATLTEAMCFEILVSLSLRLQRAGLPFLPDQAPVKPTSLSPLGTGPSTAGTPAASASAADTSTADKSGPNSSETNGALPTLLMLCLMTAASALLGVGYAKAQPLPQGHPGQAPTEQGPTAASSRIPPAVMREGVWYSQLNQFVLSPREGALHVSYLSLFSNPDGSREANIALPFPAGLENLKISDNPMAVMADLKTAWPVVRIPVTAGQTELRAEFTLPAPFGRAKWNDPGLPRLPGTTLILLPEHDGLLRTMFENVMPGVNIWPPRIVDAPTEFLTRRIQDTLEPTDPNYEMFTRMPPQFTRHLVRSTTESLSFPQFEVVGLVPSRVPLYLLTALVSAVLFGVAVFSIANARKSAPARTV